MIPAINMEKLADIQRIASKLERLPKDIRMYVAGYVECAANTSEQAREPTERQAG